MPEKLLDSKEITKEATQSSNGLMSSVDKKKLDGISPGAINTSVDLLYTNPNPYTATDGLNISLDLSNYRLILIDFINEAGRADYASGQWFPIGASCCAYGSGHNDGRVLRRPFSTSFFGVSFSAASYDDGTYNLNLLVPWHIFGVK